MAKTVYVQRLDEIGEDPVDLHQCRRFEIIKNRGSGRVRIFYLTPEERWVECSNLPSDWPFQEVASRPSYQEVHPIEATFALSGNYKALPKELHVHRRYCDPWLYFEWLTEGVAGGSPAARACPHWDETDRTLYFDGVLVRRYARAAPRQFALLGAFEAEGWPDSSIKHPFTNIHVLRQTVKDFNRGSSLDGTTPWRFMFQVENCRVRWKHRDTPPQRP
jgi:hypothetical protein